MRKRVLGTIAAFTVGAGAVFAQSPQTPVPPPTALGPVPGYDGGFQPAGGPQVGEIIPPPVGSFGPMGPGGPEMGGYPGGGYPGGDPGAGGPMYPPGLHGQQAWEGAFAQSGGAAAQSRANCFYLDSQFLLFFVKAQPANVPFVSTSAPQDAGIAGRPTTTLLFSQSDLGYNVFSGFNITGGYFRDADRRIGIELGGMLLERKSNAYYAASDTNGIPVLARPFIDAATGNPAVLTVAQQGLASGSVSVVTRNEIYGGEASLLTNLYRSCPDDGCKINVNGIAGFRFMEIHEDLRIDSASTIIGNGQPRFNGAAIFSPAVVGVSDSFDVFNRFYGGQFGINATATCGRWNFGLKAKIALGVMNETLDIDGRSNLLDTQRNLFAQGIGGLYANAQNIGRTRHDEFAVLSDVGTNLGYNWTSWFTTAIGYSYLQVNHVLRPGNVISNTVNSAILPTSQNFGTGTVVPLAARTFPQTDFWAQGVTFSMILKY
ncbi:BBP7 family outer membrane beta-barrel protein [Limnoglobus roseus]|uniref:BBP7 family outer membrane beta-barrel protein n=1 Tax=Limnoglobus roseus TaxID=2598579 RepID=A0A5C1A6U4_9BACT|nr:BBP7 family outer membrane beta-barrel protein [Limnoglobus roseus]QEL13947.1 hypothetical protein PX52LOC_00807 [Limnoglobus roseus]